MVFFLLIFLISYLGINVAMKVELTMIIMQVYVDIFAIAMLLLGGALACYGESIYHNK